MRFRRVMVPAVLAVAALIPASSVAAPAPSSSVQIAAQAHFNTPATIVVTVTAQCAPFVSGGMLFTTTSVSVFVSQPQTLGSGGGNAVVTCDNQKHTVAVTVTGTLFNLGKADARAQLFGFEFVQDVRAITIVA